ncbi:MAG: hypothetical protein JWN40_228 [Phycisphaerales bacterium]|nr:hypothetical protein [Phycisphaerales bacterium]
MSSSVFFVSFVAELFMSMSMAASGSTCGFAAKCERLSIRPWGASLSRPRQPRVLVIRGPCNSRYEDDGRENKKKAVVADVHHR